MNREMALKNGKNVYGIVYSKFYSDVFARASEYPDYVGHSVDHLIPKIEEFERLRGLTGDEKAAETEKRKENLKSLLNQNDCSLRSDSSFCNEYINFTTTADIEEVVAVMIITKKLFAHSHIAWSQLSGTYETSLEEKVLKMNEEWISAANDITNSREFAANAASCEPDSEEEYWRERIRRHDRFW